MAHSVYDRISVHIDELLVDSNASIPVNQRLFDEAELVLPNQIPPEQCLLLVQKLSALLQNISQDPTPATNLLARLLDGFTFADVLAFDPPVNFASGLAAEQWMGPFNRLMLLILQKATSSPSDAATVASWPEVVRALVRLWLCTDDTGVASLAGALLLDLLAVDREIKSPIPDQPILSGGQGLVWKRVFGDRDVYGTFFAVCSLQAKHAKVELSRNQRTVAQARLLEWLPKVARLDWGAVSRSHHTEVEAPYGVSESGGLLDFAALLMVDYKDDVLMYRCLIDFYSQLLSDTLPRDEITAATLEQSSGLEYLMKKDVHARTANLYLQQAGQELDLMESTFLYGPASNYIATYASLYPKHFLASDMPRQVVERLNHALSLSPARWAHSDSPKHDLHLIASLPRAALLPNSGWSRNWRSNPVALLPSKATNSDVLNTLAILFHGPQKQIINFPATSPMASSSEQDETEASAARALYMHYLANNQLFWKDITSHADTVALMELALSAINCLTAVITANWSSGIPVPSDIIATPETSHLAILSPPALEYALPYLLKPPRTFANLVGGRGDSESAAYKIAAAKFDALKALHSRLVMQAELEPGQGFEDILATINKRLVEGPLSREGDVGGQVGTMEL